MLVCNSIVVSSDPPCELLINSVNLDFVGILPNLVLLTFSVSLISLQVTRTLIIYLTIKQSAATLMTVLGRRIYREIKDKAKEDIIEESESKTPGFDKSIIQKNDISMLITVVASEIKKKIEMDAEAVREIRQKKEGESSDDDDEEEENGEKGGENEQGGGKKYKQYFM